MTPEKSILAFATVVSAGQPGDVCIMNSSAQSCHLGSGGCIQIDCPDDLPPRTPIGTLITQRMSGGRREERNPSHVEIVEAPAEYVLKGCVEPEKPIPEQTGIDF